MCDEIMQENRDFLVTETVLDPAVSADKLLVLLRARKTTGQLVFHLSQGGTQKVALTEKTKTLDEEESDKIRKILGMDE